MLPWTGYYINLDRSQQRRASIESELRAAGIMSSYRRFPAVDGSLLAPVEGLTGAEFGCIRSHSEVILKLRPDTGFVHVLEDDAILARCFVAVLAPFIKAGTFDEYDLIFTDVFPWDPSALTLRKLKSGYDAAVTDGGTRFNLIDLHGFNFGGTNSYLVNTKRLRNLLKAVNGFALRREKLEPMDLLYRRQINARNLRAACVFPFISAVDIDFGQTSTISQRDLLLPSNLFRHAFYVDCDFARVSALLARLNERFAGDRQMSLLADIQRLTIGGDLKGAAGHSSASAAIPTARLRA